MKKRNVKVCSWVVGQTSILESTIKNAQTNLQTANEQYCEPAELVA